MKRKNKKIKKLVACLVCAVMIGSAVLCMPEFSASATENTTTQSQTYGEWQETQPVNGSFEAGYEGMEVYGWSKTSMGNTNPDSKNEEGYEDWYTLTTAIEDGNKVAALEKKGAGYVGATSSEIKVSGAQTYRMTFDYKTVSYAIKNADNTNGQKYFGIRLIVEELDAEGNTVLVNGNQLTRYYYDESNTSNWQTGVAEFETQESTDSIIIYLWMGGEFNMYATVYFDDVCITACDSDDLLNGDFEAVTYSALGGRDVNTAGPANWSIVSCAVDGMVRDESSWLANYVISTEEDEATGNHYMKMAPVATTKGYILAQSNYIPVSAQQSYIISYDLKAEGNTTDTRCLPRLVIYYYDSDYNVSVKTNDHSYSVTEWETFSYADTAPDNAAYMTVNFYIGGTWNNDTPIHYIDNVSVTACDANNVINGDFEASTYSALGGRDANTAGPVNWNMVSCAIGGAVRDESSWLANYIIATEEDETTGNHYMKIAPVSKTKGYVLAQSNKIPVSSRQNYTISYDLKVEGSTTSSDCVPRLVIYYYDSNNAVVSDSIRIQAHDYSVTTWTTFSFTDTVPDSAVYMTVNFYIGGVWDTNTPIHYIDNVSIIERWTSETTMAHGTVPRPDASNFTGNYTMTMVNAGENHESAYKLSITRNGGGMGAAVYFSDPIDVEGNATYKTTYELKIEGLTDAEATTGASYMVRFIQEDGSYVMNDSNFATELNGHPKADQDWKAYEHTFTVPESAVKMQLGMLIGVATMNTNPSMAFYYDNITMTEVKEAVLLETDLLFVMLEDGNANNTVDTTVDVCDLIHVKKYLVGAIDNILETADMNKNTLYNDDDITLLEWKLLGVTTTEQAKSVR